MDRQLRDRGTGVSPHLAYLGQTFIYLFSPTPNPQLPKPRGLIFRGVQTSGVTAMSNLHKGRHLMELPMLTFDEAEAACVHANGEDRKQFCVDDVLATDNAELANE